MLGDLVTHFRLFLLAIFQLYFIIESAVLIWLFVNHEEYDSEVLGYFALKAIVFFVSSMAVFGMLIYSKLKKDANDDLCGMSLLGFGWILLASPVFYVYYAVYLATTVYGVYISIEYIGTLAAWYKFTWISSILDTGFLMLLIVYYCVIHKKN
jgi:hypothetical protein